MNKYNFYVFCVKKQLSTKTRNKERMKFNGYLFRVCVLRTFVVKNHPLLRYIGYILD